MLAGSCAALFATGGASAGGFTIDLTCSGSMRGVFTPPLNNNTTTGNATGQLTGCSSPNGSQPSLTSATVSVPNFVATGCFPVMTLTGIARFTWNNATTSTLDAVISTNLLVPPIIDISVTDGPMTGDDWTPVPLFIPTGLGCGLLGSGTSALDVPLITSLFTH